MYLKRQKKISDKYSVGTKTRKNLGSKNRDFREIRELRKSRESRDWEDLIPIPGIGRSHSGLEALLSSKGSFV